MTKLFLGCGPLPIHKQHLEYVDSSWTLIDAYIRDAGIVQMDARHLEYSDNSVEQIYSSHLLEHIGLRETQSTLMEWYRVLIPGGKIILNVPDMEWLAEELLNQIAGKDPESKVFNSQQKLMEVVYGNQDHEGEYHKSGFTKSVLEDLLRVVGFKNVDIKQMWDAHEMGILLVKAEK